MRIAKFLSSVSNALEFLFCFVFCIRNRKFGTKINEVLSHHCPFIACWFFFKKKSGSISAVLGQRSFESNPVALRT